MEAMVRRMFTWSLLVFAMLVPSLALGQTGSNIAGVVKDTTGAVLPGVTVEAASPALIEKIRTVVTDAEGQYKIIDLAPGTYAVSFTLTGFNTVRREGIDLTASFTATVNAELRVGAVAETVTVSGATPTVDVQNIVTERVMTRDIIDGIPSGSRAVISVGVLIPGVTTNNQDVGGIAYSSSQIAIHGGRAGEQLLLYDGLYYNTGQGLGGQYIAMAMNDGTVQESSLETAGLSAESALGGIRTNIIPKEGGNTFKGAFFGAYSNSSLQSDNLDSALVARGLTVTPKVTKLNDINPGFGGPIVKDRLWFYGSWRRWDGDRTVPGIFYNLTPIGHVYTPDPTRPAQSDELLTNESLRLTAQLSPRNKVSIQFQDGSRLMPGYGYALATAGGVSSAGLLNAPEATLFSKTTPDLFGLMRWTSPVTNRLLLEAGAAFTDKIFPYYPQPGVSLDTPGYTERSTGISWGNIISAYGFNQAPQYNTNFTASYVTGSHAAKLGVTFMQGYSYTTQNITNNGVTLQLLNGIPNQVTVYATPLHYRENLKANLGIFGQDQWTIKHLTLNLGLRYEYYNAYVPAESEGPGPNAPGRNYSFSPVYDVPNWKNVLPRVGVAYDPFGDGKTAIKASLSKYVEGPQTFIFTKVGEPAAGVVTNTTRTWNDKNGDFLAECDFTNPAANGECGAASNKNFDTPIVGTQYDPSALTNRGYNWEVQTSVQREVLPGVSVSASYDRRWYGNLRVTQNRAVTSANFSPYCITAPTDPNLPGGGGDQICGFYDINPAQFGQANNFVSVAPQLQDVYDGIDLAANARLPKGVILAGGISVGRERTNDCYELNDLSLAFPAATSGATAPRTSAFCDVRPPFQPNVKVLTVYPLPWWWLQSAATFQSLPGPQITASYVVSNAQIAPSLGRNLSAGANGTATVDLIPPGSLYGERLYQVDIRGTKILRIRRSRIMASVDLYNLLNGNAVLTENLTYGPAWQRPTAILQPRLLKFSVQVDF
jgi:hypothetical protein